MHGSFGAFGLAVLAWRDADSAEAALDGLQLVVNSLRRQLAAEHSTLHALKEQKSGGILFSESPIF